MVVISPEVPNGKKKFGSRSSNSFLLFYIVSSTKQALTIILWIEGLLSKIPSETGYLSPNQLRLPSSYSMPFEFPETGNWNWFGNNSRIRDEMTIDTPFG